MRLEYRPANDSQPWQQVAIKPTKDSDHTARHDGHAVWVDPDHADAIRVRLHVQDLAGNPAVSQALAEPGAIPAHESEQWVDKRLDKSPHRDDLPEPSSIEPRQWPVDQTAEAPLSEKRPVRTFVPDPPDLAQSFPGEDRQPNRHAPEESERGRATDSQANLSTGDANGQNGKVPTGETSLDPFSEDGFDASASVVLPETRRSPTHPPIGDPRDPTMESEVPYSLEHLPAGERLRLINSRRFAIDYSLERQPGDGPLLVDVWLTRDGGRTWILQATDDDGKSPATVQVDEEGLYGFRLSSRELADSRAFDPPSGEKPSIWIGVDRTRPEARLIRAEPSPGDGGPASVHFAWESQDKRPSDQGAALYFSAGGGQPWALIAQDLPPSGSHVWRVPSDVAPRMYFRLEVRDEAGNVATADWPHPVSLRPPRSPVRIDGITPHGGAPQGSRSQRRYLR